MANSTPVDEHPHRDDMDDKATRVPNRLILCFDGTGNAFKGTPEDTNIVKLLDMFDRSAPRQMHYYQPGIGTYTTEGSVNQNLFGRIKRSITQTIDSGLATSFDAHVIAGYRFLMRYYGTGDRIYIFGFSRGAFTARFVARMIAHVGLLSMGNEEMVPFAYKVYQDYEMGVHNAGPYMETFRSTFCRHEVVEGSNASVNAQTDDLLNLSEDCCSDEDTCTDESTGDRSESKTMETGVKVHFLGLFDTVNSVGTFDVPFTKTMKIPNVIGTAEHVRHAVAVDERRVKFKAALLAQDQRDEDDPVRGNKSTETIKEVWFPGNHGDIGGGWLPKEEPEKRVTWWQRLMPWLPRPKKPAATEAGTQEAHIEKEGDRFQLSDIALKWMIDELDNLPQNTDHVLWNPKKQSFMNRFASHSQQAIQGFLHDTMTIGGGSSFGKSIFWKIMEYLPFIRRWEFSNKRDKWEYVTFPLNKGDTRDIPRGAFLHQSVIDRMDTFKTYRPHNQVSIGPKGSQLEETLTGALEKKAAHDTDDGLGGRLWQLGSVQEDPAAQLRSRGESSR